ncbi:3-keto-disaccharide hydrolase [Tundrisphaera lichenicola]|uniref:3-keto-disaccharide hydrolase n=1 Tax=Tundrisphaera lichenicola TaxID=2029860 RepID=UPI003EB8CE93
MQLLPRLTTLALLLMLIPTPSGAGEVPTFARDPAPVRSGAPIFRFNGKDLTGFYTFTRYQKYDDRLGVFRVEDGIVRVSGREFGGFATQESFSNYHLIVEWRWAGGTCPPRRWRARNSGVMVHGSGPDGAAFASWMESIECQIIEGGTGDLIVVPAKGKASPRLTAEVRRGSDGQPYFQRGNPPVEHGAGRINWWGRDASWKDVLWFRGEADLERPVGEWNRMEVVCDGDSITVLLNGTLVNAATRSSLTSGKILFQSEGAAIDFRTIEVRPLLK